MAARGYMASLRDCSWDNLSTESLCRKHSLYRTVRRLMYYFEKVQTCACIALLDIDRLHSAKTYIIIYSRSVNLSVYHFSQTHYACLRTQQIEIVDAC